jgi:hypothetical protein
VKIEHQRETLVSVVSRWHEQSICARPLAGHQLLGRHTGHVGKSATDGRRSTLRIACAALNNSNDVMMNGRRIFLSFVNVVDARK